MRLIIASNNAHKTREIREILGGFFSDMQTLKDAGLSIDVLEDGRSFSENAIKKAEEVLAQTDFDAALADDSGLAVDALFGAPGIYSARYAGAGHDDAANNAKLMADMRDVPDDMRTCRFVCAVALAVRSRSTVCVTGVCEGTLLKEARGSDGFGYDPYFFYAPLQKSFAELSPAEKNAVSHRHNALTLLRERLEADKP